MKSVVIRGGLPYLPGVPHLHVNSPLIVEMLSENYRVFELPRVKLP